MRRTYFMIGNNISLRSSVMKRDMTTKRNFVLIVNYSILLWFIIFWSCSFSWSYFLHCSVNCIVLVPTWKLDQILSSCTYCQPLAKFQFLQFPSVSNCPDCYRDSGLLEVGPVSQEQKPERKSLMAWYVRERTHPLSWPHVGWFPPGQAIVWVTKQV